MFYIGFLPFAPGTFGSLAGIVLFLLIQTLGGFPLLIFSIILIFVTGCISSHYYILENNHEHDPQEIVIDEVVGQLVSCIPISFNIWWFNSNGFSIFSFDWIIAFAIFRVFDIWKPWPINIADRIKSAFGVMLDDLIAGAYSAIVIYGLILAL